MNCKGCKRPLLASEKCICQKEKLLFTGMTHGVDKNQFFVYEGSREDNQNLKTVHIFLYSGKRTLIDDGIIKSEKIGEWLDCRLDW